MAGHETEYRAGARACLTAMRQLPSKFSQDPEQSAEEYHAEIDAALALILATAGDLPPRAAGALALLAEILVYQEQNSGEPNLDQWVPESTMTPAERDASRGQFADELAAADAADQLNVLQFSSKRGLR